MMHLKILQKSHHKGMQPLKTTKVIQGKTKQNRITNIFNELHFNTANLFCDGNIYSKIIIPPDIG